MELIKDTIQSVIQRLADKKGRPGLDDPEEWLKKALTKKELEHIKFKYFKKGILGIGVDSSPRLYSMTLKKEELLAELKKSAPGIKDIRFRIGEIK